MEGTLTAQPVSVAEAIPDITADEAYALLQVQLDRFLAVIETLEPEDWFKPTACSEWTVWDIVAHQAGGYASGTSYREMFRQYARIPGPGQLPEDAVNAFQIRQRANRTPEELIAELRKVGPVAIQKWAHQFGLIKQISIPHAIAGKLSLRYLMWIIHSRDTWMHRLDICRAAGRPFEHTAAQDGRIVALIVRDAAQQMAARSAGKSIAIDLSGVAGGRWQIGQGEPSAVIRMDALDFCIFASGRYTFDEARSLTSISGDSVLASDLLKHTLILF